MAYVICSGGLGNQMFQYAYYKKLALENENVFLDVSYFKYNNVHNGYELNRCFGIDTKKCPKNYYSKSWEIVYKIMSRMHFKKMLNVKYESYIRENPNEKIKKNDVLNGYWQSEKYFADVSHEVIKDFNFKNISEESQKVAEEMKNCNSVAVHIRRGDYLGLSRYVNLAQTNYYKNATEYINKTVENPVFYVFSDDVQWCKANMEFPGKTVYVDFNKGDKSYQDMYLMSSAKNIILANSSFSWWAGYLGEHDMVIRPSKYKTVWTKENDELLYPKNWVKMEI